MIRMEHCPAILICIIHRSAVQNGNEYLNLRRLRLNKRRKHELTDEALVARCVGVPFGGVAGRCVIAFVVVNSLDHEKRHERYE